MGMNGHSRDAEGSLEKALLQSTTTHDDDTSTNHHTGREASKNTGKHSTMTEAMQLETKKHLYYLPLYKAALEGDWITAFNFFKEDPNSIYADVTERPMTALHVAIGTGMSLEFVQKLVGLMSDESLQMKDKFWNTPLHSAAAVGNLEAARVLVQNNSRLPQLANYFHETPLHTAAKFAHKDTIWYLLLKTSHEDPSPFTDQRGAKLLNLLLVADFYDIALYLLKRFPELATEKDSNNDTALGILARKPHAFLSGSELGCFQRLLYHCRFSNPSHPSTIWLQMCLPAYTKCIYHIIIFISLILLVFSGICLNENSFTQSAEPKFPEGKQLANLLKSRMFGYFHHVYDTKLMHMQTREIAKILCNNTVNSNKLDAEQMLGAPMHTAATMGIHELVEDIIKAYPFSVWFRSGEEMRNVFHQAVLNRKENVFNLLYHMSLQKHFITETKDAYGNNILHLAGLLGPTDQISGPALQMQRELQWFEEVEKHVKPSFKQELNTKKTKAKEDKNSKNVPGEVFANNNEGEKENSKGKTPKEVFSENHKDLVEKGGQWMKDTATSCTVVAALVVGAVFSGASSPPGGIDSNGIPVFINHPAFMIYEASDALAMFASATSVLMFLGILTNRYAEKDFLRALPMRLCIGLVSLFFAILFMLAAFGSSLYLILVHRVKWVAAPIVLLACIPITLFGLLQFPLLVEVAWSTFGPSRFGPKGKKIIC
ncbi:hypothetical protein K2173_024544 [Erythroxylum novogranatense]|uniref:PGG domain-containing protein n=1 Tax=Erythroxylum novogranatense TaxID=1862640 RepID=A0AAV8SVX0_9ROSI|nr:hypothetical protein K2173_024544 [Erythroxylum novogranatense]